MNEYMKETQFVQQLSNTITEFIPATIMPESAWTFNLKPIFYHPFELTLTYLTTTPGCSEDCSETYGTSIIAPEQASPVNLPRLSSDELALLRIFGIQRALTLHPSQNRQVKSVFSNEQLLLPQTSQLSQLSGLFEIALSKAGVADKYPFVVFAEGQEVIEVLGKCAGHRLAASFSPRGVCINLGVSNFMNWQALKNLRRIEQQQSAHISVLPILSRYYENTTRDLYDRNAGNVKVNVIRENEASAPEIRFPARSSLEELINLMKTRHSGRKSYQNQFLDKDQERNCYLNSGYLDSRLEDQKAENSQTFPISVEMSRYIRYFPSLSYGQISAVTPLGDTIGDAWNVFNHLPSLAKERGTAVESIIVHELCFNPISEVDFRNELSKLAVRLTKQHSEGATDGNCKCPLETLEYEHKSELLSIILANQNLSLNFNEIPSENALRAIQCTSYFGTAAINSFTDKQLDMDEAMIWAFNAIYENATSTTVEQYIQLVSSFSELQDTKLNENQLDVLKAFVVNPSTKLDSFDYQTATEYNIMNECPPCCCLCRCGELFLTMGPSDALNFAKDIISELKFRDLELRQFDAINHSIIYQKLAQINQIKHNLTNHIFVSYIPYTADQVLKIYAEFSESDRSFDKFMKQFYFEQLVFQILQFAEERKTQDFTTSFIEDFVEHTEEENKKFGYPEQTVPFASHMSSAQLRSLNISNIPLMYPFNNQFVLILIFLFLHEIQDIAASEKFLDSLKELIELNYKTLFQQSQQFFETELNLTYFIKFCAFQGLQWGFIRNLRSLRKIEDFESEYEIINGYGYEEAQNYLHLGQLNPDFSPSLVEINRISLLYENIHFVADFYQVSLLQAKLLLTAITPFEPNDREVFKKSSRFKFSCWELVLNSISPSEINNLPHRFYAQFMGGDVEKNMFHISFKDMACCSMVETVPFRAFGK